jgi:hypothetical protein
MTTKWSDDNESQELFPDVAAVAARMGDPEETYVQFLSRYDGARFITDPTFFWSQPLSDRGYFELMNRTVAVSAAQPASTGKSTGGKGSSSDNSGARKSDSGALGVAVGISNVIGMIAGVVALSCAMLF